MCIKFHQPAFTVAHVLKRFPLRLQSHIIILMFPSSMLGECIKHVLLINVITPTVTIRAHLQRRQLEFRRNILSNDYNPVCGWLRGKQPNTPAWGGSRHEKESKLVNPTPVGGCTLCLLLLFVETSDLYVSFHSL